MRAPALVFCLVLGVGATAFAASDNNALHAEPWVFGQSLDRNNDLWRKGVHGDIISRKNTSKAQPKNTADQTQRKQQTHGTVGIGMRRETSTWSVDPARKDIRPDEGMTRERRNVLGAYADVQTGDDFNINFGPEIILKDEEHSAEGAASDQPDSALGLGMKFKYDF